MRTEHVHLVKTCTTVHACCDTVSAYQFILQLITASDSHVSLTAENSNLLKLSHCSQC